MAAPTTGKFEHLALEVETAVPGTYAKVCGVKGLSITREAQVDEVEVPADCTDESLPFRIERQVRALSFSIEGEAVWARENHETLLAWFYTSASKNIRVQHGNVATGDTEFETGPAYLTTLNYTREKGQKLSAQITILFDGTPTRTDKV